MKECQVHRLHRFHHKTYERRWCRFSVIFHLLYPPEVHFLRSFSRRKSLLVVAIWSVKLQGKICLHFFVMNFQFSIFDIVKNGMTNLHTTTKHSFICSRSSPTICSHVIRATAGDNGGTSSHLQLFLSVNHEDLFPWQPDLTGNLRLRSKDLVMITCLSYAEKQK